MLLKKVSFDEAIDFSALNLGVYREAFKKALESGRSRLKDLKAFDARANPLAFAKSFAELSTELEEVAEVFFTLIKSEGVAEDHAYAQELSPELSRFESEVSLDLELFNKVDEAVKSFHSQNPQELQWKRALERSHRDFIRNGVNLESSKKEELKKIDEELGVLALKYQENVLKDTAAYSCTVDTEEELKGLPERDIEAAKAKATAKGVSGFLITLDAPTYVSVVTYAENRDLREKLWRAYATRCFKGPHDNSENTLRIAQLRQKRAQLLGFKTHSHFVLSERMAKTPENVHNFLKRLVEVSKPKAVEEIKEIETFAKEINFPMPLKNWDLAYLSEKFKKKTLQFDEEELRPYFKLESVIDGLFATVNRLFSINLVERLDLPKFNSETRVFEVKDNSGDYLGLFYLDIFPRETKSPGAWMSTFRGQGSWNGVVKRPHVVNICNFTKPTSTKPSLLSFSEVETLFHEFGHGLHELLSKVEVRSLAGTRVLWDFVELPSQIMENWVHHPEGLALIAKHYQTGAAMPADLVEKIQEAKRFMAGLGSLRQAQFAMLDLNWHYLKNIDDVKDIEAFEVEATKDLQLFTRIPGVCSSVSFAHIFSGGYSSGYYSYKWAEVLDADAFEYFIEKGIYNKEVAMKFRDQILSRGNSEDPEILYKKFRGRDPDPNALFRRDGLLETP